MSSAFKIINTQHGKIVKMNHSTANIFNPSFFEEFGETFQKKARHGFIELSKKFPHRCKIIKANRTPQEVSKEIIYNFQILMRASAWRKEC